MYLSLEICDTTLNLLFLYLGLNLNLNFKLSLTSDKKQKQKTLALPHHINYHLCVKKTGSFQLTISTWFVFGMQKFKSNLV